MKSIFSTVLAILLLSGCASYHVGHYKRSLPGGYDRIAIPMFGNKTEEVGIESYFTKALRMEFERSRLATVTSKNDAQVILEGTITSLNVIGSNPTNKDDGTGLETPVVINTNTPNPLPKGTTLNRNYVSNIYVSITARKVSDNSILWQGNFSSGRNYQAALLGSPQYTYANPLYNQSAKVSTIEKQAVDMMTEAHDRLTENF